MAKRNVRARTTDGLKLCYTCSKWQEEAEFGPSKVNADGLAVECDTCKLKRRLPKYGITFDRYNAMLEAQDGVCAICQQPPSRAFDIDHDHDCCPQGSSCGKCVRGLLCFNCNSALGKLKDDVNSLKRAVIYLTKESRGSGNQTP